MTDHPAEANTMACQNTKHSNDPEDSNLEDKGFIPALRHYHPGICQTCNLIPLIDKNLLLDNLNKTPKIKSELKICSQCQLVSYCSKECQRKDWLSHKEICKANRLEDGRNIFSEAKCKARDQKTWHTLRSDQILAASVNLGRELDHYEKELFLYPRVCFICRESKPSNLFDCNVCHSVFFCSDNHWKESLDHHEKWCASYLLSLQCYIYLSENGIPDLSFPTIVDDVYTKFTEKRMDLVLSEMHMHFDPLNYKINTILVTLLSERLSYALSVVYALQTIVISSNKKPCYERSEIKIHLVGAENTKEIFGVHWEYVLHRFPLLKKLHVVFIGPDLFFNSGDEETIPDNHHLEDSGMTGCDHCQVNNRIVVYEMCQITYKEFYESHYYSEPDIVVAFNWGLGDSSDEGSWINSLDNMIFNPDVPLVFTSYTESEAIKDFEILNKTLSSKKNIEILMPIHKNPYSSLLPARDFLPDKDRDVFFTNQYICCVHSSK